MRHIFLCLSFLFASTLVAADLSTPAGASESKADERAWLEISIGVIGTASVDILEHALGQAQKQGNAGLLMRLDTAGGSLEATRSMVKSMLASPLPIIVWVGPSGAHAGSAGAFITLAAHFAVMAPGTQIGAAHPVAGNGENLDPTSDLRRKVENDTIALMDSIAQIRGRNPQMARSFVATSVSLSAEEALSEKVIDLIARDPLTALTELQGRELTIGDKSTKIEGTAITSYVMSWREQALEILSNPNLFYLLFIVGLLGIGFELTHPGTLAPGVIGALSLILALISSSILPINAGAMLMIIASIAFMIAEIFVPSFGILGIGGFAGFILGSVFLIDASQELGLRIAWYTIAPGAILLLGFIALVSYLVIHNQRARVRSGAEGLRGKRTEALEDFRQGRGQVRLDGEIWNAEVRPPSYSVAKGSQLEVLAVDGLILIVKLI